MFEKSLKNAPHFLTYVLVNSAFCKRANLLA